MTEDRPNTDDYVRQRILEYKRRYREQIRSDPERWAQVQAYNRQYYLTVTKADPEKWRRHLENARRYYWRKKAERQALQSEQCDE